MSSSTDGVPHSRGTPASSRRAAAVQSVATSATSRSCSTCTAAIRLTVDRNRSRRSATPGAGCRGLRSSCVVDMPANLRATTDSLGRQNTARTPLSTKEIRQDLWTNRYRLDRQVTAQHEATAAATASPPPAGGSAREPTRPPPMQERRRGSRVPRAPFPCDRPRPGTQPPPAHRQARAGAPRAARPRRRHDPTAPRSQASGCADAPTPDSFRQPAPERSPPGSLHGRSVGHAPGPRSAARPARSRPPKRPSLMAVTRTRRPAPRRQLGAGCGGGSAASRTSAHSVPPTPGRSPRAARPASARRTPRRRSGTAAPA